MPFDATDHMFHALDWPSVSMTQELLAMRICQLSQCEEYLEKAALSSLESCNQAAHTYNQKHAACMFKGEYWPGELVLLVNECQHFQHDLKGQPRWFGSYVVVK